MKMLFIFKLATFGFSGWVEAGAPSSFEFGPTIHPYAARHFAHPQPVLASLTLSLMRPWERLAILETR